MAAGGLVIVAFGLSWGMILGRAESDLAFYACAFAQAALAFWAGRLAEGSRSRVAFPVLIAGAALLRLWFVAQTPTLSGDIYRYIWDGKLVNAGFNPYLHVPADPALIALRDPSQYGLIDKRDYAVTLYPPVAEAIFALIARLSTQVWAMKLAMVLFEACAIIAAARLLRRLGRPPGRLAAYLLHPAPIWEIAGNGHVDAAMMALMFGTFAWGGGASRPYRSALPMTLGALVKPTAALGLPALWRPAQMALPLFVLAVAVLCYLPFAGAGLGVVGFLPNYTREQGLDSGQGFFWLALLTKAGLFRPAMVRVYEAFAIAGLFALALWSRRGGATDVASALGGTALLLVAFLLLISPVFPWYCLAALPFTPLIGVWSPFALSTGGFLLYSFHSDAPPFFGRWSLMMGLAVAAAIWDIVGVVWKGAR